MGASDWNYVVAYQPDLNRALQELRQREFEAGRYHPPAALLSQTLAQGWQPAPRTVAELRAGTAEDGTHSILDVERIAGQPAFGAAAPLSLPELDQAFGGPRPSLETVLRAARTGALAGLRRRWEGLYVIAYSGGRPSHIFFFGYSGD